MISKLVDFIYSTFMSVTVVVMLVAFLIGAEPKFFNQPVKDVAMKDLVFVVILMIYLNATIWNKK